MMLPHSSRGIMKVTKALGKGQMFSEIPPGFLMSSIAAELNSSALGCLIVPLPLRGIR